MYADTLLPFFLHSSQPKRNTCFLYSTFSLVYKFSVNNFSYFFELISLNIHFYIVIISCPKGKERTGMSFIKAK